MSVDMLEIDSDGLYFDEPLHTETQQCIDQAAEEYGNELAEPLLMRAYLLEPEHPVVLVALYRFFYYQHRLKDALIVADRVLLLFARRLGWPQDWQALTSTVLDDNAPQRMTMIRFYLLALKGAGFLQLRLGEHSAAIERLEKVSELDSHDRLGAKALLDVAQAALNQDT